MLFLNRYQLSKSAIETAVVSGCISRTTQFCQIGIQRFEQKVVRGVLVGALLVVSAGCSNTVDDSDGDNNNPNNATSDGTGIVGNPSSTEPVELIGNTDVSQPSAMQNPAPQIDQSGVAQNNNDLAQLLLTEFVVENDRFVPTTGWICTDTINQQRIYYFYPQGVLDANRSVAIERTLNSNNTHTDILFFWSVAASDALVMTTVNRDDNGMLLTTGQQYDFNSIRFQSVDSVQTFAAETVLRGRLVCGNFALR